MKIIVIRILPSITFAGEVSLIYMTFEDKKMLDDEQNVTTYFEKK